MKKFTSILFMAMTAMTISAQSTRTIYLDVNIWATEDNPVYAVHVWNTGDEDAADYWLENVEGNIWKADIRDDATSAIFLRKNPADAEVMTNIWGGWWNRSTTAIPADKDLHKITSWSEGEDGLDHGEWSVYGEEGQGEGQGDGQGQSTDKVIVKVLKPAAWEKIYAYEWAEGKKDADLLGGWPGTELQDLGNGWFGAYVPANANLIINNGSDEQANDYVITASVCLENISNRADASVAADCANVPDPQEGGNPDVTPADKVIVKVLKPAAWEKIYAYEWASGKNDVDLLGGWPGMELQDLGNGWFGEYVPANANLIVNNGSDEQANDYYITASVCLENISNRADVSVAADCANVPDPQEGGNPDVEPAKDVIVKVLKPADWASMNIWAWGSKDATFMAQFTEWPGVPMQALENGWYQFTVKDDATFIVNNGEGTLQSQAAQTKEAACFSITADKNEEGHFAIVNADCPADDQAIDQTNHKSEIINHKYIKNGQLIIVRDGVEYNAFGTKL